MGKKFSRWDVLHMVLMVLFIVLTLVLLFEDANGTHEQMTTAPETSDMKEETLIVDKLIDEGVELGQIFTNQQNSSFQ